MEHRYLVRVWVDVEVSAETDSDAFEAVNRLPMQVSGADVYDIQTYRIIKVDGEYHPDWSKR